MTKEQKELGKTGLELFKGTKNTYRPKVSIRKNAQIAISAGASRKFGFRDESDRLQYDYFLLLFNREKGLIGLRPTNEKQEGVVKARNHQSGEIQLACQSFFDKYGVPYDETRRFPMEHDKENDIYLIYLEDNDGLSIN